MISSNLVNQKPFYYYVNEVDLGSANFTNAGQISLHYCENSTISNINISRTLTGIELDNCFNITIVNSNSSYNQGTGIYLTYCNNITVLNTTLDENDDIGLQLLSTHNCNITGNSMKNCDVGIELLYSTKNEIVKNIMENCGIFISDDSTPPIPVNDIANSNTVNGNPVY